MIEIGAIQSDQCIAIEVPYSGDVSGFVAIQLNAIVQQRI